MGIRNLLEFHNACAKSAGKRYIDYGRAAPSPGELRVHPSGSAVIYTDDDAYFVAGSFVAEAALRDYFGTTPDPQLAMRCQFQFVEPKIQPNGLVTFTVEELHDWLEGDCDARTFYEQEGIVRKLVRRWRGL